MSLLNILHHQWRRRARSPTFGSNLVGGVLLALAAGYFGALFVALGWFYPDLVLEVAPEHNPLQLLNESLLYAALALVPFRFFLQRSAENDARPYLDLPLHRPQLVRIMQILSALSWFNLLPVVVLGVLWGSTVLPATSVTGAAFWTAGAVLVVAATEFLNSLLRVAWNRNTSIVLGAVGFLAVAVVGDDWMSFELIRGFSAWLFGGLLAVQILPLLILSAGTAGIAVAAHRALRTELYSVIDDSGQIQGRFDGALRGRGAGREGVASITLLEIKLILRNKRPRQMLGVSLLAVSLVTVGLANGVVQGGSGEGLLGLFISGFPGIMYHQFGYGWHGSHFEGLLERGLSFQSVVTGRYTVFGILCFGPVLGLFPILGVIQPDLLPGIAALCMYNLGVTGPVVLWIGQWNRRILQLDQSTFFNPGTSMRTSMLGGFALYPTIGVPIGLLAGLNSPMNLLVVAGLGAVGLVVSPFWLSKLARGLRQERHNLVVAFQKDR